MSGSGGGGGYQYQAQATAFIATHILAKQPLHWIEHSVADVPTIVAEETNGPGDDIRITLQDGSVVEVQAKHGLKKNEKFWEAIIKLTRGLVENPSLYGVLLTDCTASSTIRDELRKDVERLGQGREDNLKTITQEVRKRLREAGISHSSDIFRRFRIVIADLDNSQRDAKTALGLLTLILKNREQAGQAWKVLSDDGLDLIQKRGQRDAEALSRLLGSNGLRLSPATILEREVDWQEICRGMLPIELDSNPLISGDGVALGIEDIVPLDLVEQKERPKPTRDRSPENSQQILEDQEIPLPYNQFFDHVLTECKSLNQQGKGIAIIGEPGAGKTTLLCAIADWIMKRGELPVFVSLQDLETGLEPYLLKVWLKDAIRKREASALLQDDLIEQCNAGRVWLLLDGVDEMTQAQQSLSSLAKELQGWLGNVRIVLTCRVNVWDANRNELRSKFGIYRSRGFRDEDQLIFINNFFAKAKQLETGDKLIEKLTSAPARLKDLIKSPLWITLLCRTWKRREGKLPATKAELYEGFTKTFYDWKDKPYVPEEKRSLLERALGEIAKKAIDQQDFRFRLRETFIRQELDKFDSSFFHIACELGWINKLGKAVENPDEAVYAFLHPTFQEYFAALAIDDWHYFFNHVSSDPSKGIYRIFESQWKEVFLLWLGRENVRLEEKEEIIAFLISFGDSCEDFYGGFHHYQAYFLVASASSEFCSSSISISRIIKQLVELTFGYIDFGKQTWIAFPSVIADKAESSLFEAERSVVVNTVVGLMAQIRERKSLGDTINENFVLTKAIKLITSTDLETGILDLAQLLLKLAPGNRTAIDALRNLLNCSGWLRERAALSLEQADPSNLEAKDICKSLEKDITALRSMDTVFEAISSSRRFLYRDVKTMTNESLIQRLHESYENKDLAFTIIERIGEVGVGDKELIIALIHYLFGQNDSILCKNIYLALKITITQELFLEAIKTLRGYFISCSQTTGLYAREYGLPLLWYCIQNVDYPSFYRTWYDSSANTELSTDN